MGLFAHHRDAMGAVAQRAKSGNVIGMQMGVDRLDQFEIELANELEIALEFFQDWIDDQCLAAGPAGEKIGISPGYAVKELAKNHVLILTGTIHDMTDLRRASGGANEQDRSGRKVRVV